MPPTIAFLHTSPVHVATFDALLAAADPQASAVHHTDVSLLADARQHGVGAGLPARVEAAVRDLAARADVVVCTCSTIGALAAGVAAAVPVQRVDAAMADAAVAAGPRIVVVAALESTLGPTGDLVRERAGAAGAAVEIRLHVIPGAWDHFEAGDVAGYHSAIAAALPGLAADADVVVLAQASMAGAVEGVAGIGIPVLSSPRLGVAGALATARAGDTA